MDIGLNELSAIYSDQLFLELTLADQERAREQISGGRYPNSSAHWQAYLNQLCLNQLISFLESEPDIQYSLDIWPGQSELPLIWSILNGSVLSLPNTRLALIPMEAENTEFRVQREWLDLSDWVVHYLLAMQVNIDEGWIQVWGYATHQQFRELGQYDFLDETYSLPCEMLNEDLAALWVGLEYPTEVSPMVAELPPLPQSEVPALLDVLGDCRDYSPRLELPFEQWGALISNAEYLRQLYDDRLPPLTADLAAPERQINQPINDLRRWLQTGLEAGWQTLEAVFGVPPDNLSFAFRQGPSSARANLMAGVKVLNLAGQWGEVEVVLLIAITALEQTRMGLQVQLLPSPGQSSLPVGIHLQLWSQADQLLQESVARRPDTLIQLKRFSCPEGRQFRIQVTLEDCTVTETFVVSL
jgi:hypothetical protein